VLAANVDVVVVVAPLDADLRLSKLERYLAFAWASGAEPVVALSKADQCRDLDAALAQASGVAVGVPVHPVAAFAPNGLDPLLPYVSYGRTAVLVGPSGAGKSTIASVLSGDAEISTGPVRRDGKGRHTTTWRELVTLPTGGALLDTPGLRGLALWDAADGVDSAFREISELAHDCRFTDCAHSTEPGCAVRAAIASGGLSEQRLIGYRKMLREQAWIERRHDSRAKSEATAQIRKVRRSARRNGPRRGD
jgi:ribosome biogenesis GTPase